MVIAMKFANSLRFKKTQLMFFYPGFYSKAPAKSALFIYSKNNRGCVYCTAQSPRTGAVLFSCISKSRFPALLSRFPVKVVFLTSIGRHWKSMEAIDRLGRLRIERFTCSVSTSCSMSKSRNPFRAHQAF